MLFLAQLGIFPWEILSRFPKESQLWPSHATQATIVLTYLFPTLECYTILPGRFYATIGYLCIHVQVIARR